MSDFTRLLMLNNGLMTVLIDVNICHLIAHSWMLLKKPFLKWSFSFANNTAITGQQHSNNRNNLLDSIDRGIRWITGMDCWSYVQHTRQFYDACLDRSHIDNTVPAPDTSDDDSTEDEIEMMLMNMKNSQPQCNTCYNDIICWLTHLSQCSKALHCIYLNCTWILEYYLVLQ